MEGVGPGTMLGGRFTTTTRVAQADGTERWEATEPELARSVSILCLPADDPRVPAVLDAARVAAGLEIPTTVRVLDIGTEGPVAYVVEESLADARSVADLVRSGGLPGDEVRRIAGEVATALAAAGARGVHHLRLSPDGVFRTSEGAIKVRGLAIAAALADLDEGGEAAARTDAAGVVALTYAGLTGLWPLEGTTTSLDPAPRSFGGVAPPSEIAAGVPRDLDGLCRMTLNGRSGPTSAGDFARQIAPWSSRQIVGRSTLLADLGKPESPSPAALAPDAAVTSAAPTSSATPTPAAAAHDSAPTPTSATPAAARATAGAVGAAGAGAAAGAAAAPATPQQPAIPSGAPAPSSPPDRGRPAPAAAAARTPSAARAAAPARHAASDPPPPPELEPPAPGLPAEPLTREQSKLALALVAAFVVLSLLVGINGVRKIGSQTDIDFGAAPAASHTPSPSATAEAGLQPKAILSADGFDPLGDNSENGDLAPRVFDGNPDTEWMSEGYRTANLGGLKPGVGVVIDIGASVTPRMIRLNVKTPADVTVLVSSSRSLDGAVTAGQLTGASGQVEVEVPADAGEKQYVIVWFTNVSRDADGFFRARLGEVTVLG